MQITSKALQLNFWQHKTRQGEIFTNTKSWKYGECKHCRPLVTKAGCSWGARVAFWCRIEVLLATRILAFIPKWCKAIERKANYVQKWCQLNKLLASYCEQNFFPSNTFWIKTKTKKNPGIIAGQNLHVYLHEAGWVYCVCNMVTPPTFLWNQS